MFGDDSLSGKVSEDRRIWRGEAEDHRLIVGRFHCCQISSPDSTEIERWMLIYVVEGKRHILRAECLPIAPENPLAGLHGQFEAILTPFVRYPKKRGFIPIHGIDIE